jgi:hypothetical protein
MEMGGQRHAPTALTQEIIGAHYIGGWVDLRAGLDVCGKSRPHSDSVTAVQSVASRIYRPRFPDPDKTCNTEL